MVRIIAFVGMAGSGKSYASKVALQLGIPVVNMGEAVRVEVEKRGIQSTDASIGNLASELRKQEGPQAIAMRCIPLICEVNGELVVIDGIRSGDEVSAFRDEFDEDLLLVRVDAPLESRRERIAQRGREDDAGLNLEARDERELGWGMGEAMESADVVIDNSGSPEEFLKVINRLLGEQLYDASIAVAIYPTEDRKLVFRAVNNFFPEVVPEFECDTGQYELHSCDVSLLKLHRLLREQRILDTARNQITFEVTEQPGGGMDAFVVRFNKQAAFAGRVSFATGDEPLGSIALRVESGRMERLIDWLVPRTEDGRPVEEITWP